MKLLGHQNPYLTPLHSHPDKGVVAISRCAHTLRDGTLPSFPEDCAFGDLHTISPACLGRPHLDRWAAPFRPLLHGHLRGER